MSVRYSIAAENRANPPQPKAAAWGPATSYELATSRAGRLWSIDVPTSCSENTARYTAGRNTVPNVMLGTILNSA